MAARILVGLTQEELASAAGLSVSALKRLERGETDPNTRTVEKLRSALERRGVQFVYEADSDVEGIRCKRAQS